MNGTNEPDKRQQDGPNPVDIHVGGRIRMRRILLGKSQETVAGQLGVSFQQLQKYERGANRVSASRLYDIAQILMTPVAYFFDEMSSDPAASIGDPSDADPTAKSVMHNRMTLDLIRDFYRITSPRQQRCVLELVRAIADGGGDDSAVVDMAERRPGRKR